MTPSPDTAALARSGTMEFSLTLIRLLILDVDGVLTAGSLPYEAAGNIEKVFFVQDGGAIRLWQRMGGQVAIISGRTSPAVTTRAKDLGVTHLHMAVEDKLPVFESLIRQTGVAPAESAFMGDDLLDLPPMSRCGYPIAPANAVAVVKRAAKYVTRRAGGAGAVHEAIERLMRHNGWWDEWMRQRTGRPQSEPN